MKVESFCGVSVMQTVKVCTECLVEKPIDEYHNQKCSKTGKIRKTAKCKPCIHLKNKLWREKNKEKDREYTRKRMAKWRAENPERYRESKRNLYYKNHEKELERMRQWRAANPDKAKASTKKWRENNKERHLEALKSWRERNKDHVDSYRKYYYESVRKNDHAYRAQMKLRAPLYNYMGYLIGRLNSTSKSQMSYTPEDLKDHLTKHFKPGMSWENYGDWQIDHTIPIAHYVREGILDPEIVNALSNIRPLWRDENLKKAASIPD